MGRRVLVIVAAILPSAIYLALCVAVAVVWYRHFGSRGIGVPMLVLLAPVAVVVTPRLLHRLILRKQIRPNGEQPPRSKTVD